MLGIRKPVFYGLDRAAGEDFGIIYCDGALCT